MVIRKKIVRSNSPLPKHPSASAWNWRLQAKSVSAIFYDFDGVMTDNRILQFQDGTEAVTVNRADGLGIQLLKSRGIPQIIISTETNPIVAARARKLNLPCIQACKDKKRAIEDFCEARQLVLASVAFVGNDLNDGEALQAVGYPVCPSDAHATVLALCRYRLRASGGDGVIRELAERIQ